MAEIIWTEPALGQLEAIAAYIALDKPDAAALVMERILEVTENLVAFTKLGRPVPELPHPQYRQVWIPPCWLYYRIEAERLYILHVRRSERPLRKEDLSS